MYACHRTFDFCWRDLSRPARVCGRWPRIGRFIPLQLVEELDAARLTRHYARHVRDRRVMGSAGANEPRNARPCRPAHDRYHASSRAGCRQCLVRCRGGRRARPPPPLDHRPDAGRRPADGLRLTAAIVITFNGEVYNFAEIRARARSAAAAHSAATPIPRSSRSHRAVGASRPRSSGSIGMFAFALWDRRERALYLVRDRLGIKPLYWAQFGELFALRLRAQGAARASRLAAGASIATRSRASCGTAMCRRRTRSIRASTSFRPARSLTLRVGAASRESARLLGRSRRSRAQGRARDPSSVSDASRRRARALLARRGQAAHDRRRAARRVPLRRHRFLDRRRADAGEQHAAGAQTFTIGFHEKGYRRGAARQAPSPRISAPTTPSSMSTPDQALTVIPHLPEMYDEPFADASQIPTFLVSEMTRKHVTVALSGDGGDELFGGYNRYLQLQTLFAALDKMPQAHRCADGGRDPRRAAAALGRGLARLVPDAAAAAAARRQDARSSPACSMAAPRRFLPRLVITHWRRAEALVAGASAARAHRRRSTRRRLARSPIERMQYLDMRHLSARRHPDQGRPREHGRVARGARAAARSPRRRVRLAAAAPIARSRGGAGKWLLRQVLYRYVPRALIERPKMGFGVPIDSWLRGPLARLGRGAARRGPAQARRHSRAGADPPEMGASTSPASATGSICSGTC